MASSTYSHDFSSAIKRSQRHFPPSHFTLKIESYSVLSEIDLPYVSDVFEAGGHKWRLSLYPKGKDKMNGNGHISLYLVIAETEKLPLGWEVNVSFKLFVFDQIRDQYLTVQDADGSIKRFNDMKTEWGFAKFLPLDTFNDAAYGYVVNDCCIFGAEVFVHERSAKRQCVSMTKKPANGTFTWKMENFSKRCREYYYSPEFTVEGFQWKLVVYPKGSLDQTPEAISVFLLCSSILQSEQKIYAEYKLRIRDHVSGNHKEFRAGKRWFSPSNRSWGYIKFLLTKDLNNASMGFLVNDTLIVEAEIILMSNVKQLSEQATL